MNIVSSSFLWIGEPPHIHVRSGNKIAKFWLDPVVLERAGGFSRAELSKIIRIVQQDRERFLEKWHEFFGS